MATEDQIRAALTAAGIDPDEAPTPTRPRPDPSQGARGHDNPADFRTADKETFEAELRKFGVNPRSK